jgi:8-oxo-dGTP diphosphatase
MSLDGQRLDPGRYAVIPRTISFIVRHSEILLIKLPPDHSGWAGRYNGFGGHVEIGEDPLSAARRELLEETGLTVSDQKLCGVVTVDTGDSPGIGLFVFVGKSIEGSLEPSSEGTPAWLPLDDLAAFKLVDDLEFLIPQALKANSESTVFFATYTYNSQGELQIALAE